MTETSSLIPGPAKALATRRPLNLRRLGWHYAGIQSIYWANIACLSAYAVIILQSRGFSFTQIGLIMACRPLASIIMQPLVASTADRLRQRIPLKYFCLALLLVAFAANLGLLFSGSGYSLAIICFALIGCSENVLAPLNDSLAIQYINGGYPLNYSVARGIGSLVFALTCLLLARLVRYTDNNMVLVLHAVLLVAEFFVLLTFRSYPGPAEGETERVRPTTGQRRTYGQILRSSKPLLIFLAAAFCVYLGNNTIWQYLATIVTYSGGHNEDIGVTLFLLTASQFVMSLFFSRLSRRFGVLPLLIVGYCFVFLRMMILQLAFSPAFVLWVMPFELLAGGLTIPSEVLYINQIIDPADMVKGQSLLRIIPGGIAIMLSSLLGGRLLDLAGVGGLLRASALSILAGFLILSAFSLVRRKWRLEID